MFPGLQNKLKLSGVFGKWYAFAAVAASLCGGFWVFHAFTVSGLRESHREALNREIERSKDSIAQFRANSESVLTSLRRENEARSETIRAEYQAKLRELDLVNQSSVARVEEQARREKETLIGIVDGLRQKLSVSRSSLEISAAGEFVSVNDLLIDEQAARGKLAEGSFVNIKRLLLPNYTTEGWQKLEGVSLEQVNGYLRDKTVKLAPDDETAAQVQWQPLLTIWAKDSNDAIAAVGAAQLSKREFVEFLQKANTSSITVTTDKDGVKSQRTETTTLDAKALGDIPIGVSAYTILATTLLSDYIQGNSQSVAVTSFSARTDALHYAATVTNGDAKRYDFEILVLQDSAGIFILFDAYSTENALDPVSREATDWLRAVRILKR